MALSFYEPLINTLQGSFSTTSGLDQIPTYTRIYTKFGSSDLIRQKLSRMGSDRGGEGYREYGEFLENNEPPGKCYFRAVKTYESEDQRRFLNCFAYALSSIGCSLDHLSLSTTINIALDRHFESIDSPQDGDLAVYSTAMSVFTSSGYEVFPGNTHAGIYRNSSEKGGSIESKWGWFWNPYVFEHSPFLVPDFYGDTIKFYRLRSACAKLPHVDVEQDVYTAHRSGCLIESESQSRYS